MNGDTQLSDLLMLDMRLPASPYGLVALGGLNLQTALQHRSISGCIHLISSSMTKRKCLDDVRIIHCLEGFHVCPSAGKQGIIVVELDAGKAERKDKLAEPGKDVLAIVWLDVVEAALGSERVVDVSISCIYPTFLLVKVKSDPILGESTSIIAALCEVTEASSGNIVHCSCMTQWPLYNDQCQPGVHGGLNLSVKHHKRIHGFTESLIKWFVSDFRRNS